MACAAYTKQYYAIFFPYLFISIIKITKIKIIIFFCLTSLIMSVPGWLLLYKHPVLFNSLDSKTTDFKSSILIVLSITFVYLVPFFISNFKFKIIEINRLLKNKNSLLFLFCLLIIYLLIKKDYTEFIKYTQYKKSQLNFLHKLIFDKEWEYAKHNSILIKPTGGEKSYLYLNPVIVELFYNIREYSQYNISSYINSIIHCNNVIAIEYQCKIGLNREYMNYEMAIDETKKALNELSSVIYNLPLAKQGYIKLKYTIKTLHGLLNKHIQVIGELFKNDNKVNDINMFSMPDNFYDNYFLIMANDTYTDEYNSTYNLY